MSTYRRRTALVGVGALTAGLLLTSPQSAEAANLVKNPGFETAGTGDMPYCWEKAGWGDNDFTYETTSDAHSGTKAMKVTLTRRVDGDRKAMLTESTDCAPGVSVGKQYDLGLWYKTTTPDANVTLFRHDSTTGWQYWTDVKTLDMASAWTRATVRTPAVPAGTDRITWGVSVYGTGSATTDDYTMEQVADPLPPAACTGTNDQCADGSWSVLPTRNPVRSMHSVVLSNGKVLLIAGSGNSEDAFAAGTFTSAVYDPANGTYKVIPTPKDLFCAGHVQLQDGRVLVLSGNKAYPVAGGHGYEGFKDSYLFDPSTETYTRTNDLNDAHWYPSATELGNGDVITFGGLREDSTGSVTADRWSDRDQQWLPTWKVNQTWSFWGLYPSMILMQDGRLFYSGSHVFGNNIPGTGSAVYDYDANTITQIPGLRNKDERDQSASVLLPPAQDQRVLTIGGGNIDSNPDAGRLTDVIDLKQPNPSYVAGPPLPQGTVDLGAGKVAETGAQGKMYVSAVLLPDGKVLETGGALHNRANPVYESSIYDPGTGTFDPVTADPESRGYHSSAFLLPDGRVMATGDNPGNGSWNRNVSIYTPPYLYKGTRPTITSLINQEWKYGDTQRITVDHPVAKAELIRPAAVTHSSDPNQRFVDLPLSVDGNNVDLNVTNNPNVAPPGWYMLFAVDANGVPSVARWVHLTGPAALSPTTAAPHVHAFADSLSGKESGPGPKRTSQAVSPTISGCDRHYGSLNVCVPTVFPAQVRKTPAARCAWLGQNHYGRLKVNGGDDPLGLDRNRNGVACEKADTGRR
ncbi:MULTISPECIES: galactose oxidase early set domain-containing protein [Streptomyces]|uniref:galactose oxidase early set domain-containing protein n=1 Tax=Streptomyces TaxID=1883 RepID=UPI0004CCF38A|nr:galactose oxidase early set domain-containing protein [Streptomyces durhamensis]